LGIDDAVAEGKSGAVGSEGLRLDVGTAKQKVSITWWPWVLWMVRVWEGDRMVAIPRRAGMVWRFGMLNGYGLEKWDSSE
jgi:hypothetical protein